MKGLINSRTVGVVNIDFNVDKDLELVLLNRTRKKSTTITNLVPKKSNNNTTTSTKG